MKKLVILVIFLLTVACSKQKGDSALQDFVIGKLVKKNGTLKLSKFKDVQWDKVYILGPYMNEKMYDARLKANNRVIIDSGILTDDGLCLLMLFNGDKLVSDAVFDRRTTDFSSLTRFSDNMKLQSYTKDKANFPYLKREKKYLITQQPL